MPECGRHKFSTSRQIIARVWEARIFISRKEIKSKFVVPIKSVERMEINCQSKLQI